MMSDTVRGHLLLPEVIHFNNVTFLVAFTFISAVVIQLSIKLVVAFIKRHNDRAAVRHIDGPPPHWFYGNVHQIPRGKGLEKILEWVQKYGPVFKIHIGPLAVEVVLVSPDSIKAVMNTAEPKDPFYPLLRPWIGNGLLLSSGKKWARNRRLLTPAFHFDILKPYQCVFTESVMVLVSKWRNILAKNPEQSLEMFEHISLYTLDSLMKCIFSKESNFQLDGKRNPYIKAVYEISDILIDRGRFFPYHSDLIFALSYSGYKLRKAINVAHTFSKGVIQQKRKEKTMVQSSRKYLDFMDMLLACRDEEGNGLSDQEIQDEVDTFMFEGHDTTASGISWCLYNMACHPHIQEKCRKEVKQVLGERDEVTWEDTSELPYLTMCIKESLRLHPPVPRIGRQLTKPVTLTGGKVLPPGTIVGLSISGCHHNPDIWPEPDEFDPERFNPNNMKSRNTHAFIPFSAGPRNCIGQHFAMNELKTTMALLLKHFTFLPDEENIPVRQPDLVLRTKYGLWLKVKSI